MVGGLGCPSHTLYVELTKQPNADVWNEEWGTQYQEDPCDCTADVQNTET